MLDSTGELQRVGEMEYGTRSTLAAVDRPRVSHCLFLRSRGHPDNRHINCWVLHKPRWLGSPIIWQQSHEHSWKRGNTHPELGGFQFEINLTTWELRIGNRAKQLCNRGEILKTSGNTTRYPRMGPIFEQKDMTPSAGNGKSVAFCQN